MLKTKKARDDVTGMNPQLDIAGYSYVFLLHTPCMDSFLASTL